MAEWSGENLHQESGSGSLLHRAALLLARLIEDESDRWFLWVPVFFGAGIGLYFSLPSEPTFYSIIAALCITLSLCVATRKKPFLWTISVACFCASLGFADARVRTLSVAQPSLEGSGGFHVLKGWVEKTQARLPRGQRITLRPFGASNAKKAPLPHRVRYTSRFDAVPVTGSAVEVRLRLRPVPEPVMPGGFDFSRKAFYAGLGAVGFALAPARPLDAAPPPPFDIALRAKVDGLRHGIERRILEVIPGERGAVVIALITGERGRIPEATLAALRNSGLAHMLAISGLHMALMAGSLFWLLRAGAAAFPALALRYPIKKWAAVLALLGGGFYLAISGGSIATQRAFLMMGIVFTAILLDRPALTLRNVAMAACVILALFPESLLDVSFQMSFAAVTGLVAVYERTSKRKPSSTVHTLWGRVAQKTLWYVGGIALTTLVAGIAVAPFAAFHFHKLAQFSLVANLGAMPPFGLVVMPAALAALLTMPFGLETLPLQIMAWGIDHVVWVAKEVSSWPGSTVRVATMPVASLLALSVGGLWLCLWQKSWRLAGLGIASIGLAMAGSTPRPDLLIGRDGKLLAVRTQDDTLSVTGGKKASYSLEQWLRADGDPRDPVLALKGQNFKCDDLACIAKVKGKTVAFVRHPAALAEECARADIVVAQIPINRPCPKARVTVDRIDLWADGAHALYLDGQSIRVETVAQSRGTRPWSRTVSRRRKPAPNGNAYAGETGAPEKKY
jgi:competence protein ComEC